MKRDFVKLAFFSDERDVAVFQARLEEVGIRSFLSNANANVLLPHIGGGIGVHINKEDLEAGKEILEKYQEMQEKDQSVFTHHEATHADIEYEKELHTGKKNPIWAKLIIALIALVILRFIAKGLGFLPQDFEPF